MLYFCGKDKIMLSKCVTTSPISYQKVMDNYKFFLKCQKLRPKAPFRTAYSKCDERYGVELRLQTYYELSQRFNDYFRKFCIKLIAVFLESIRLW